MVLIMNIRDLKYLVALAEAGHFGKAAEICYVSQPALSMQIRKLEDELGVKLLERTTKSILLTEPGVAITEQAREVLRQVDILKQLAQQTHDPYAGDFYLGVIPTVAAYLLPHIVPALKKAFPRLNLYLIEEQTHVLLDKLKQAKLDAAILALPITERGLTESLLFEEEFMLAVPNAHPLAKQKTVDLTDLQDIPLLLLEDGHCLREAALEVCYLAKTSEARGFRATSLETLRHMVSANAGVTLMPKLACKVGDGVSYLPFKKPKPARRLGLVFRQSTVRKALLDKVVSELKAVAAFETGSAL